MIHELEDLFEKFRDLDKNFQLLSGVDGHVLFIPRLNSAFLVGKALQKVNSETDFPDALKKSVIDYSTIGQYLKKSHNATDFTTRATQIVLDTACCNIMGLTDDVGAGLAESYSAHRIEQMAKAISENRTMSGSIYSLKETRRRITLRLHGPKNSYRSIGLANKPPHPKVEELFNLKNTNSSINSIRGGSISLQVNEIENQKSLLDLILSNKNRISAILICGVALYAYFKKFKFVQKFFRKIQKISNH